MDSTADACKANMYSIHALENNKVCLLETILSDRDEMVVSKTDHVPSREIQ